MDVGGGASSLVDQLLARGFARVTVVDISEVSLELARARLGVAAARVTWLVADARTLTLPEPADVWHDRAVFHFLTDVADQDAYLTALRGAVRVGGHVVMATFGRGGPDKCSGLLVERYDPTALAERLGREFSPLRLVEKEHVTPQGSRQQFTYGLFRRIS